MRSSQGERLGRRLVAGDDHRRRRAAAAAATTLWTSWLAAFGLLASREGAAGAGAGVGGASARCWRLLGDRPGRFVARGTGRIAVEVLNGSRERHGFKGPRGRSTEGLFSYAAAGAAELHRPAAADAAAAAFIAALLGQPRMLPCRRQQPPVSTVLKPALCSPRRRSVALQSRRRKRTRAAHTYISQPGG